MTELEQEVKLIIIVKLLLLILIWGYFFRSPEKKTILDIQAHYLNVNIINKN